MLWIMGRFGAVPEMEWRSQHYARAGWCFSASKAPDLRKKSEFRPIFDQIVAFEPNGPEGEASLECVLCMESYEGGVAVRRLPCNHYYHAECVDQ